jgi:hypothetical protein
MKSIVDVLRDIGHACITIQGTRDIHSISLVGAIHTNRLKKKSLSCFLHFCQFDKFNECENL